MVAAIVAAPEDQRSESLIAYWDTVERRVARQREIRTHLLIAFAGKERNFDMYAIHERDIPGQIVLTEQRHISADDLPDWMGDAFGRMWTAAPRYGGITGPLLAIFHGQVTTDSDGPVEICAPVADGQAASGFPTRTEPAHSAAYTRLRKHQVQFPEILSAYDAVEQWIARNGKTITGPPREVSFADFMNAGPDDEVVDIAPPIGAER